MNRGFSNSSKNPLAKGSRAHQYGEEQHRSKKRGELRRQGGTGWMVEVTLRAGGFS